MLSPIVNNNTDILFIPLNPSKESSRLGHFFAANELFWATMHTAGFFKASIFLKQYANEERIKKYLVLIQNQYADEVIFKTHTKNFRDNIYSIHDLVPDFVSSNSNDVKISSYHILNIFQVIKELNPRFVIIMHEMVKKRLLVSSRDNSKLDFNNQEYQKWATSRKEFHQIKQQLSDDWGAWGKVFSTLNAFFFCVPFPSTQCASRNEHTLFWEAIMKDIKSVLLEEHN